MPINSTEVVFLESKDMSDSPDAGGEMTARVIKSGESGNVWPDISRLDRTTGGVEMRKIYMAIVAANSEAYSGAHVIIDRPAADPRVNMFLMNLGDHYDNRQHARDSVESFVVKAGRSPLELNGNHLRDQTDLSCWMQLDADEPKIGDTLALIEDDDEGQEQYVRIKSLSIETKTFTYLNGAAYANFTAKSVLIGLSAGLDRNFSANQASPIVTNATAILRTQPAPGVEYFSARALQGPAILGQTSIKVDSIQQQLLPVATTENPMIDLAVSNTQRIRPIHGLTIEVAISASASDSGVWFLPRPPTPGTLELTMSGSRYHEVGGEFVRDSGSERFNDVVTIEHGSGQIKYQAKGNYSGTLAYTPAQSEVAPVFTEAAEVTDLSRGINWTFNLSPLPVAGSVVVRYLYKGDWIKLSDNGSGQLVGAGSGSINYESGTVLVTTAALPELSSSVLISWSEMDAATAALAPASAGELEFKVAAIIDQGPVAITWTVGGNTKTISRPDAATAFSGDGTARVVLSQGKSYFYFNPSALSDAADYAVAYNAYSNQIVTDSVHIAQITPSGPTSLELALGHQVATNYGSFTLRAAVVAAIEYRHYSGTIETTYSQYYLKFECYVKGGAIHNSRHGDFGGVCGTLNAATGLITLDLEKLKTHGRGSHRVQVEDERGKWSQLSRVWTSLRPTIIEQDVDITSIAIDAIVTAENSPVTPVLMAHLALVDCVPNSICFKVGNDYYYDDDKGRVFKNFSSETGASEPAGSIVREGDDTLVALDASELNALIVTPLGALERVGHEAPAQSVAFFYLPAAPIRPGTVQIYFDTPEGDKVVLKADAAGLLYEFDRVASGKTISELLPTEPNVTISNNRYYGYSRSGSRRSGHSGDYGVIDYDTGQIIIDFQDSVATELVTVNAVQTVSTPLDADLIGLDSVRMPSNGLVPVFKPGNVLVVHHTAALAVPTLSAAQVLDAGRLDLASLFIADSEGTALDPAQYTVDLSLGTATLADPLVVQDTSAQALVAPFELTHRVETMALCNEVSLDGTLGLALPLDRDIPEGGIVSSAIALGDVQARASNLFSQTTDVSGQFPDSLSADPTNARVNDLDYPFLMDSRGAVKDKWKIKFKSVTAFDVFSERRGAVISGSIIEDLSPINPVSGVPYFTIRQEAWGSSGWSTGNIVRFDTAPAAAPVWAMRSIQPGPTALEVDSFSLQARGDTDQ